MTGRILVADDEPDILEPLEYGLRLEGFDVECVRDGDAALAAALGGDFDLLILDLVMPKLTGREVCSRLRATSTIPIIMLTARDAELDRVVGLELGADDYVTKPFSIAELVSRVRAILRRQEFERRANSGGTRRIGSLELDLARHEVRVDGRTVHLTRSEFKLLAYLAAEPGRVFSRRQIMEHLWQSTYVGDERACDTHVSNLRRKLDGGRETPSRIVTVRDIGYKLGSA